MDSISEAQREASQWYVAHCKAQKEAQAALALAEQLGLAVYLPEVRRRSRERLRRRPFFPGYLFVRADLGSVALSRINSLPGIIQLVAFDGLPQAVPATVVEGLRRQVEQLNAQGGIVARDFRPGDSLRLTTGAFRGLEAFFLGPMKPSERVHILIEFLGSLRRMEVDIDQLKHTSAELADRPPRRTRGKGRPISRDNRNRDKVS
jgi:transcriptional antiterminator RfaH